MFSRQTISVNIFPERIHQIWKGQPRVTTDATTVRERIRANYATLTQSERKFATALLDNYPAAGLASITIVAANADVSTPTVARMVQKLGYKGYPQFHSALLSELEAKVSGPTQRRADWASEAPESHLLNRFAGAWAQYPKNTGQPEQHCVRRRCLTCCQIRTGGCMSWAGE